MTTRVQLKHDRDYSAVLFHMGPHREYGYRILSAQLALKEKTNVIPADRVFLYCKDGRHKYKNNGEKIPDSLYTLFATTMTKKGQGGRVVITEIREEEGKKLAKKKISVGVDLY